jgi:UDP-N-acetylglucosamine--N-acetylmuramyl-(pentapeptide) pyrophosphoryl-undecaprenol N-acetylglucosamine transferase
LGDTNTTFEYREITSLGIPFYELHAGKVYKTLNIKRLLKVPYGFFQAFYLLLKIRPNVIVSFGGYLAVPAVVAGWFLGIPSLTHEQTVVSGYANKAVAFFVKKILITWPSSEKYYPKNKVEIVGLPLRKEIFEKKSNNININADLPTNLYLGG